MSITFNQFVSNIIKESFRDQLDYIDRALPAIEDPTTHVGKKPSRFGHKTIIDPIDDTGRRLHITIDPPNRRRLGSYTPSTSSLGISYSQNDHPDEKKEYDRRARGGLLRIEDTVSRMRHVGTETGLVPRHQAEYNSEYVLPHELAHRWQHVKRDSDTSPMATGGNPFITLARTTAPGIERAERVRALLAREVGDKHGPLAQIQALNVSLDNPPGDTVGGRLLGAHERITMNSDAERNARAVQYAQHIPLLHDRHYEMLSRENPEMSHQEKLNQTRRVVMGHLRIMEPTLYPEDQSIIAGRYAPQYAKEYHRRMGDAILRHEQHRGHV